MSALARHVDLVLPAADSEQLSRALARLARRIA